MVLNKLHDQNYWNIYLSLEISYFKNTSMRKALCNSWTTCATFLPCIINDFHGHRQSKEGQGKMDLSLRS